MLFAILMLLLSIAWVVAGCGISTGPTEELTIDEPLGSAAVTDIDVTMGAGKLSIGSGATGLISGVVRYNVEAWKPQLERSDTKVAVKQGSQKGLSGLGTDLVNDWRLQLGKAPMRLHVSAGAYEGSYDLSGLVLQELTIKDGAAKTQVAFSSPNPGQMARLKYETGASTVSMTGLAYANFASMEFKGGAGSYILDFSGQLRSDAGVRIEAGVGTVRLVVPGTTAAWVTVDGALNNVSTEGEWVLNGEKYGTPAAGSGPPAKTLTISVEMSVGSLTLVAQ